MYSSIQIANFFILKHLEDKRCPIGPLKLQKMVYICYGWYWALLKKELFEDEIQAWRYGPVIPMVWHAFKPQRAEISKTYDIVQGEIPKTYDIVQGEFDADTQQVLKGIYNAYINQSNNQIIAICHAPGTPWSSIYDGTNDKEIPREAIWSYYEGLLALREKTTKK